MSFGKVKESAAARREREQQRRAERALVQPEEAIERIERRFGPGSAPRTLPRHVGPYASYMRLKEGVDPSNREIVKAYAITRSSIQRQARTTSKVCERYPEYRPLKQLVQRKSVRPEDVFATLLLSQYGQKYLDAAERGRFDEEAARQVVERTRCFGFADTLYDDLRYGVELSRRGDEVRQAFRAKPEDWIKYVQKQVKGVSSAKAGFLASMMGRGDVATFDAREIKLWNKKVPLSKKQRDKIGCDTRTTPSGDRVYTGSRGGKKDSRCADLPEVKPEDVLAYRERIRRYPLKLDARDERNREHLVHHAIWDAYPEEGEAQTKTTHGAVIRAMQFAGVKRAKSVKRKRR